MELAAQAGLAVTGPKRQIGIPMPLQAAQNFFLDSRNMKLSR